MVKRKRNQVELTTEERERPTKRVNNTRDKSPIQKASTKIPFVSEPSASGSTLNPKPNLESKPKHITRKLAPQRPFPTVARSVNASGPKSSHREGANLICITRKTSLGRYLQRCKDILVDGEHKFLILHALGAAIPHLMLLTTSLPLILPFPRDQIRIDARTYTINCTEEIIPEDEDEDITYQVKGRSAIGVLIRVGDVGIPRIFEGADVPAGKKKGKRKRKRETKEGENECAVVDGRDDLGTPIREDTEEDTGEFVYEEGSQEED